MSEPFILPLSKGQFVMLLLALPGDNPEEPVVFPVKKVTVSEDTVTVLIRKGKKQYPENFFAGRPFSIFGFPTSKKYQKDVPECIKRFSPEEIQTAFLASSPKASLDKKTQCPLIESLPMTVLLEPAEHFDNGYEQALVGRVQKSFVDREYCQENDRLNYDKINKTVDDFASLLTAHRPVPVEKSFKQKEIKEDEETLRRRREAEEKAEELLASARAGRPVPKKSRKQKDYAFDHQAAVADVEKLIVSSTKEKPKDSGKKTESELKAMLKRLPEPPDKRDLNIVMGAFGILLLICLYLFGSQKKDGVFYVFLTLLFLAGIAYLVIQKRYNKDKKEYEQKLEEYMEKLRES